MTTPDCPFCGGTRVTVVVVVALARARCECCGALGPPSFMDRDFDSDMQGAKADAMRLWRERAREQAA